MRNFGALVSMFFGLNSFADVQVAFVEIRDPQGAIRELEPGGRFSHVAISVQGQWLHTHPYRGVEIVGLKDLEEMGNVLKVNIANHDELSLVELERYIGKPYNSTFSWNSEGHYCSELVGKILNIPPEPMKFLGETWKNKKFGDILGLSPDDIFNKITRGPYWGQIISPRCEAVFSFKNRK